MPEIGAFPGLASQGLCERAQATAPTAPIALDKAPEKAPNVAAIVGGVITAFLAIAGIVAALPMLGINLPGLPMLGM